MKHAREAKRHNDDYEKSRAGIQNRLTAEFIERFCNSDGTINWEKVVSFNSANLKEND